MAEGSELREERPAGRSSWAGRLLVVVLLIVAVAVGALIASVAVPRWWAQFIGRQIDGSITQGVFVGLIVGFVFTLLPLLVLAAVMGWLRTWRGVLVGILLAVILAIPNLLTLGIVFGSGDTAHAAERTFDVEAPGFRNFSVVGAIIAVILALAVIYLAASRHRAREKALRRKIELDILKNEAEPRPPTPPRDER